MKIIYLFLLTSGMLFAYLESFGVLAPIGEKISRGEAVSDEEMFKFYTTEPIYDAMGFVAKETSMGVTCDFYICDGGGGTFHSLNLVEMKDATYHFDLVSYDVPDVAGAAIVEELQLSFSLGYLEKGEYEAVVRRIEGGNTADGLDGKVSGVENFLFNVGVDQINIHSRGDSKVVTLSFPSREKIFYQMMCSVDLKNWTKIGVTFEGVGGTMTRKVFGEEPNTSFYKIEEVER